MVGGVNFTTLKNVMILVSCHLLKTCFTARYQKFKHNIGIEQDAL